MQNKPLLVFFSLILFCQAKFLFNSNVLEGQCKDIIVDSCLNTYQQCVNNSINNQNELCDCEGNYGICLVNAGCLNPTQYEAFIDKCQNNGYAAKVTNKESHYKTGSSNDTCNSNAADKCALTYESCERQSTNETATCNCYGSYGICLLNVNCLNKSTYPTFIANCLLANCTERECKGKGYKEE